MFRILLLLLLLLLAGLQYKLWWGDGGRAEVDALRTTVARQDKENAGLRRRNDDLAAEVADLKGGTAAVEERARSELGMIKPGETYYRVVETKPPAEARPQADEEGTADAGGAR